LKPGESGAGNVEGDSKNGVVDSVESCSEIQEDEDGEMTSISGENNVSGDFKEGCFSVVF